MLKLSTLVATLAEKHGLSEAKMNRIYRDMVAMVKESSKDGDTRIPLLVSIRHRTRKPRPGRNPKTGEPVAIPAKRILKPKILRPDTWSM